MARFPYYPDRFIGRGAELEQLASTLREPRALVTVHGPPGAGKTRLAVEVSSRSGLDSVFVALRDARDGFDVLRSVAIALGVAQQEQEFEARLEQLTHALSARAGLLVVLDNAEHLVAEVGACVGRWRQTDVRWLVTSREALGVRGENRVSIEGLRVPSADSASWDDVLGCDAVALFRARCPTWQPEDCTPRQLAGLIRRLDGLPLGIELAASRMGVIDVEQLQQRLAEGVELLRRTAPSGESFDRHHRSLQACVEWSWSQLSEFEQRFLSRCSVFPGPFSLSAADSLTGTSGDTLIDGLQSLRNKSFLRSSHSDLPGSKRYMLYHCVRVFALGQLSDEDRDAARARHRSFAHRRLTEIMSRSPLLDLDCVRDDLSRLEPDLRLAFDEGQIDLVRLQLAFGLVRASQGRGYPVDVAEQNGALYDTLDGHPLDREAERYRALLEIAHGSVLYHHGRPHEGLKQLARAQGRTASVGMADVLVYVHHRRAELLNYIAEHSRAAVDAARSVELARALQRPHLTARCLLTLSYIELNCQRFDDASEHVREAIAYTDNCPEDYNRGSLHWVHSWLLYRQGHIRAALRKCRQALDCFGPDQIHTRAIASYNVGRYALDLEQVDTAQKQLREGLLVCRRQGLLDPEGNHQFALGELALNLGNHDEARSRLERAVVCFRLSGVWIRQIHAIQYLTTLELSLGLCDDAQRWARDMMDLCIGRENHPISRLCHSLRGLVELISGDNQAASQTLARALDTPTMTNKTAKLLGSVHHIPTVADSPSHDALLVTLAEAYECMSFTLPPDVTSMRMTISLVQRLVPASLLEELELVLGERNPDILIVSMRMLRVRPPHRPWIDLGRHALGLRCLAVLAGLRRVEPQARLGVSELAAALWPGESMLEESATNRIYNCISKLRKAGLKAEIEQLDGGYRLREGVRALVIQDECARRWITSVHDQSASST